MKVLKEDQDHKKGVTFEVLRQDLVNIWTDQTIFYPTKCKRPTESRE